VDAVLGQIRTTQLDAIKKAAGAVAESMAKLGVFHVMDTGHMLRHEAFFRAGGIMSLVPFSFELKIENPADQRKVKRSAEEDAELLARTIALSLDSSKVKPGDIIIINSNSGRSSNVIELAMQCAGRGVTTIGVASLQQMTRCDVEHRSGKKLFDVVDIAIDNCGPYGDAMLEVRDNEKMCPASGMAATYILWAIQAEAVELLQAKGVNPTIFRSVHVSGMDYIDKQRASFMEKGV
jgi:uncharacterized phosphosugar-binding protein